MDLNVDNLRLHMCGFAVFVKNNVVNTLSCLEVCKHDPLGLQNRLHSNSKGRLKQLNIVRTNGVSSCLKKKNYCFQAACDRSAKDSQTNLIGVLTHASPIPALHISRSVLSPVDQPVNEGEAQRQFVAIT
jgi:hypothetical protein